MPCLASDGSSDWVALGALLVTGVGLGAIVASPPVGASGLSWSVVPTTSPSSTGNALHEVSCITSSGLLGCWPGLHGEQRYGAEPRRALERQRLVSRGHPRHEPLGRQLARRTGLRKHLGLLGRSGACPARSLTVPAHRRRPWPSTGTAGRVVHASTLPISRRAH